MVGRFCAVALLVTACSDPAAKPDAGIDANDALAATLSITPSSFNFGSIDLGTLTAPQNFLVRNISPAPVDITTVAVGGTNAADFSITMSFCPATLEPNETCNVSVLFDPTARDQRTAQLEVTGPTVATAYLQGNAVVTDQKLIFDPSIRDFGDVGVGESGQFTFNVINEAFASTLVPSIEPAGSFSVVTSDCGTQTIPLHGTCSVTVQWAPGYGGRYSATLKLTAGSESWGAGLGGTCSRPLSISPEQGTFGSMLVGQPEPTIEKTFTVTNLDMATTGTLTPSFTGAGAADYDVVSTTCTTLAKDAACDVVVRLDPSATTRGSKVAQLVVADGSATFAARTNLVGSVYTVFISGTTAFPNTTAGQQSAVQTFTIINASSRDTGTIATTLGSNFTIDSNDCAGGIPANNTCTIGVRFTPSTAGAKNASLTLTATGPGGTDTVMLTGTGL